MRAQLMSAKLIAIAVFLLLSPYSAKGADHLESPALQGQGSVDLNDLFLFQGDDPDNTVMILTVNPFAGSINGTTFNSDASYQFQFDNDGDSVPDISYNTTFSPDVDGRQTYSVERVAADGKTTIANGISGTACPTVNGGFVQAGIFDDPFLFPSLADVSAIVLEIPSVDLFGNSNEVGAQAVTTLFGVRQDRAGRPAIATVLLASDRKDAFNAGDPVNDLADFGAEINAEIARRSNQANADTLTPILLPDLLTYDASNAGGYFNGRRLDDDALNASLAMFSEGVFPEDIGGSGGPFLDAFPYLYRLNAALELGDINLDYVIDFGDIPAFISVLVSGEFQPEADCDESGLVDFGDIPAFIEILIGS